MYSMDVVKTSRVLEYIARHGRARPGLLFWLGVTKKAVWRNFNDVRRTFNSADQVDAGSGKKVIVFNIGGNNYRLICAAHYNRGKIFVLRFMTHAEYDREKWKDEL